MDELKVALGMVPAEGLVVDAVVPVAAFDERDVEQFQLSPVSVAGKLKEAGGTYLFEGRVSGTFVRACDRCLVEVRVPFEADVFWTFEEGPGTELAAEEMDQFDIEGEGDPEVFTFQGGALDLVPCVWEEVVLAYPTRFVPCEDCPELEFECMAEEYDPLRGSEQRSGVEESGNTGFAGLADMFPHLKPNKSED